MFPKYKDKKFSFSQQEIQEAISDGILVSRSKQDNCYFVAEIDKDKGWRIVRKYPNTNYSCDLTTIEFHKLFSTYEEAEQELNKYNGQMKQQSEMSDYDWAVQDIDETLNCWQKIYSISEDTKQKYRDWLLSLNKVEDVEIRISGGQIEWRYFKNQRWKNIEID